MSWRNDGETAIFLSTEFLSYALDRLWYSHFIPCEVCNHRPSHQTREVCNHIHRSPIQIRYFLPFSKSLIITQVQQNNGR